MFKEKGGKMKKIMRLTASILIITIIIFIITPQTIEASGEKDLDAMNVALLDNINALRIQKGAEPLNMDEDLTKIAMVRAKEVSSTWSHIRPDGDEWSGENLAYVKYAEYDYTDKELVSTADFMYENLAASPSHYDNMVFQNYDNIGIYTYVVSNEEGTKLLTAFMFSD